MKLLSTCSRILCVFSLLVSLTVFPQVNSTGKGSVSGIVLASDNGSLLPGASVFIKALNIGGVSDFDGRFSVTAIPVGNHQLQVSYLGYITKTIEIIVKEDDNLSLGSIMLEPSLNQLGEVIVTASIEGQQKAYNQQRNADNIKTIVSADLVNQFPDINVGEALQRVAGVNIERNNGEGANIRLRGTPRNYTTVTIDGAQLPTTDSGGNRTESLDLIPAELLSSMEITKALLPENDGDAIGGTVNLITPTARSSKGRIKGTVAGGYADIFERGSFRSKIRYDKRSEDDKFGIIIGGSYYNTVNGEERLETNYRFREVGPNEERQYVLDELALRPLLNLRTRIGANMTLDYKFNEQSTVFTSFSYNFLRDQNERYRIRFRSMGDFPNADNINEVGSGINSNARLRRDMSDDDERRENVNLTIGGRHALGAWGKLDYGYTLSRSEREETSFRTVFRAIGVNYIIDRSDRDFPQFIPQGFDVNDYSQYEFGGYQADNPNLINGFNQTGYLNVTVPLRLGNKVTGEFKTGGKFRLQENSRRRTNLQWAEYQGFYTLDQVVGDDQGSIFDGRYDMGSFPSPSRSARHFNANFDLYTFDPAESTFNTVSNSFDVEENIYAWYGQGKLSFGKFSAVFGARYEATSTNYEANVVEQVVGETTIRLDEGGPDYNFFLPSIHLKYKLTDRTNLRASYFESFARPNLIDLVPAENRNFADNEVQRGNPDLVPAFSKNVDVLVEHYFKDEGTISLGVYYKQIDDFIFTQQSVVLDDPIIEGFELIQPVNGEVADVIGVEVNFAKKFTFLPGWLNGFGIYANYTYVNSSSSFTFIEDDGTILRRDDVPLVGQADHTWNAALYYDKGKFSIRGALNYNGQSFDSFDIDPTNDFVLEERYQLDANASYRINDRLTVFAEAQNLLNTPVIQFNQFRDQVTNHEIYGIVARLGLNFNF
ncbi:TonB-dependent receptor [Winogradskyella sp.]|uniref:TonB-dependent receptor n=1 Tax=Winogradskyella sp. TaxID=1883156 RepID=UPI00261C4D8B|nr:TonB-dependent receptor [Winogradskyella sp.]